MVMAYENSKSQIGPFCMDSQQDLQIRAATRATYCFFPQVTFQITGCVSFVAKHVQTLRGFLKLGPQEKYLCLSYNIS